MNGLHNGLYSGLLQGMQSGLYNTDVLTTDADMFNFISATGNLNNLQKFYVRFLVSRLKETGLWNKIKAIYPMVGGTADSHKLNLKDPRNLDAAFRLVFTGGWVHSSTGSKPNGTTGYANTFITPGTHLSDTSTHMCYYSRNDIKTAISVEMGAFQSTNYHILFFGRTDNLTGVYHKGYEYKTTGNPNYAGLFLASRTVAGNNLSLWKNGVLVSGGAGNTQGTTSAVTIPIYLGATNSNTGAMNFSVKECSTSSIGDGLTAAEQLIYYNIIQAGQTILGRQV